jgi:hypothetical protein
VGEGRKPAWEPRGGNGSWPGIVLESKGGPCGVKKIGILLGPGGGADTVG